MASLSFPTASNVPFDHTIHANDGDHKVTEGWEFQYVPNNAEIQKLAADVLVSEGEIYYDAREQVWVGEEGEQEGGTTTPLSKKKVSKTPVVAATKGRASFGQRVRYLYDLAIFRLTTSTSSTFNKRLAEANTLEEKQQILDSMKAESTRVIAPSYTPRLDASTEETINTSYGTFSASKEAVALFKNLRDAPRVDNRPLTSAEQVVLLELCEQIVDEHHKKNNPVQPTATFYSIETAKADSTEHVENLYKFLEYPARKDIAIKGNMFTELLVTDTTPGNLALYGPKCLDKIRRMEIVNGLLNMALLAGLVFSQVTAVKLMTSWEGGPLSNKFLENFLIPFVPVYYIPDIFINLSIACINGVIIGVITITAAGLALALAASLPIILRAGLEYLLQNKQREGFKDHIVELRNEIIQKNLSEDEITKLLTNKEEFKKLFRTFPVDHELEMVLDENLLNHKKNAREGAERLEKYKKIVQENTNEGAPEAQLNRTLLLGYHKELMDIRSRITSTCADYRGLEMIRNLDNMIGSFEKEYLTESNLRTGSYNGGAAAKRFQSIKEIAGYIRA